MRSSPSTRNPRPRSRLRLLLVLAGEDHPKACTGRRLLRWKRVVRVSREDASPPEAIVLDPYAPTPLSGADREPAERGGVLAVDCSWNRLSERGSFPGEGTGSRPHRTHRRLPILIATNPQHYGRPTQLNTVEALSAALYVLGRAEEAGHLIEGFAGGDQFLLVNRDRLDRYRDAAGPADVAAAEKLLFGGGGAPRG
ncbi:MAG: ribosome biogenesis domain-containing protein [Thermoplasmata archaeon]